jgi:spore coat protein U-like protein
MKKLSVIAAALVLACSSVYAVDVTNSFTVTVGFTGACQVKTAASNLSFTYASFDVAKTASTSTVFKCSRGLTPTFSFDNPGGAQTGSAAAAVGSGITAEGVIQGVRYTLAGSSAKSSVGNAAAAGANGAGGSDGTPDEYTVGITADIAAGQAGAGAGASGTQTRVLTITY